MNYDHAFHAGNHADLLKHAILAAAVARLSIKPKPLALIDVFAAAGRYDLALDDRALRGGEWTHAAAPLWRALATDALPPSFAPFAKAWRAVNPGAELRHYPGSPEILRRLARRDAALQDKVLCVEKHPGAAAALRELMRNDKRVRVYESDGWAALESFLPPQPRRGLVLIDPPFEQPGEIDRLVAAIRRALARWSTGAIMIWSPQKTAREAALDREIATLAQDTPLLTARLTVPNAPTALKSSALLTLNPPYQLEADIADIGRVLADLLAGQFEQAWRTPPR